MTTPSDLPTPDNDGPLFAAMEIESRWPMRIAVVWEQIKLAFKHGGFVTFSATNPAFLVDGKMLNSKSAMFDMIEGPAQRFLPPYTSIWRDAGEFPRAQLEEKLDSAGVTFPLVAKPDIGADGAGVWLVENWADLETYWNKYPADARILLQQKVDHEPEAGVYYIRDPETDVPRIEFLTFKYVPAVTGDGTSTVAELIQSDPRTAGEAHKYLNKPSINLAHVPSEGERVKLAFIGNRDGGAMYRNAEAYVMADLIAAIDEIARAMGDFYFGRFDIRFKSVRGLQQGKDFKIIEVNGAYAVPGSIFDNRCSMDQAAETLKALFREAYRIGDYHRKRGVKVPSIREQFIAYRKFIRLKRRYPIAE